MAIEKMKYINIYGPQSELMRVLGVLTDLACFHPDTAGKEEFRPNVSDNPYAALLGEAQGLLADLHAEGGETPALESFELADVRSMIGGYRQKLAQSAEKHSELLEEKTLYAHTRHQLRHLEKMDVNLDDVFSLQYVKVRFGRLPKEGYRKLPYYADREFSFNSFDFDGEYYWGFYFTPEQISDEVDAIFASLHFERLRVPDFVHGTPGEALIQIAEHEAQLNAKIEELTTPTRDKTRADLDTIRRMCVWLDRQSQLYDMEKYAQVMGGTFYLSGFVPKAESRRVTGRLTAECDCKVSDPIASADAPVPPPIRLKNNWFARPFEMYVSMYGLPSYKDVDPTGCVAVTYSILFGIMFGDLGQGLCLALIGLVLARWKGMWLGGIITCCGLSGALFGCVYGSVFGFEDILPGFKIMEETTFAGLGVVSNVLLLLVLSICLGVFMLLLVMVINILNGIRQKNYEKILFGPNGAAGIVFYAGLLTAAVSTLAFGVNLFTPA